MDDCIIWQGTLNPYGYGIVNHKLAHRVAYEKAGGILIKGLELDHLCRNRACVNPEHLEQVTHAENMSRGANALKTHCLRGHRYDAKNTRITKGKRYCRRCAVITVTRYKIRKGLSKPPTPFYENFEDLAQSGKIINQPITDFHKEQYEARKLKALGGKPEGKPNE